MEKRNDHLEPDDLDHTLDVGLSKYASAEPRAGLEQRILSNLSCERSKTTNDAWWRWAAAEAAAVIVVGLVLAWKPGKPTPPAVPNYPVVATNATTPVQMPKQLDKPGESKRPHVRRAAMRPSKSLAVKTEDPKLDQFPSPEPLTDEERALIQYVRQFPSEAVTIAQAQADFEKEIQQQSKPTRDGSPSDSEQ